MGIFKSRKPKPFAHLLLSYENLSMDGKIKYNQSGAESLAKGDFYSDVQRLWRSHDIVLFTDPDRGVDGEVLKESKRAKENPQEIGGTNA